MKSVRVSIPATSANLGPGFDSLGLALSLRNSVEVTVTDGPLVVDIQGEGAERLPRDETNKVARAALSVFAQVGERAPGLHVILTNMLPPGAGLGSSAAALVGGVVVANALLDDPLSRDDVLRIAVDLEGHPDNVCAAMLGGLVIASYDEESLLYRRVAVAEMQVAIAVPAIKMLTQELRALLPKAVPLKDAAINIGRAALVVLALAEGDYDLLGEAMHDRLHEPYRNKVIPGYSQAVSAAYEAGASAVAISGSGPALVAFAPARHSEIAAAMAHAFQASTDADARTWVLPVDPHGVQVTT